MPGRRSFFRYRLVHRLDLAVHHVSRTANIVQLVIFEMKKLVMEGFEVGLIHWFLCRGCERPIHQHGLAEILNSSELLDFLGPTSD